MFVIPSQAGDMKLEANIEYRFPMFWKLNGALFADVGNIWDIHGNLEDDNLSRFDVKTLPESLAANWGAGVRLDLNFLILRVDLGVKLYNPASDIEEHWYGPGSWFSGRDAFAIHFGVGYPF
jgi:outer membrane protein assembly factor BamA